MPKEYIKELYDNCPIFDEVPFKFGQRQTDWSHIATHILINGD